MPKYRVTRVVKDTRTVNAPCEDSAVSRAFRFAYGGDNNCALDYEVEEIPPVIHYDGIIRIEGGFSRSGPSWESIRLDIEAELQAMVDRLNAETVYEEFGFQVGEIDVSSEEVIEE